MVSGLGGGCHGGDVDVDVPAWLSSFSMCMGPKWLCGWCGCQALGCVMGLNSFVGGGHRSRLGGGCCGGDVDILACLSSFGMRGGA